VRACRQALDAIEAPLRLVDAPFRMPISNVYKIKGVGTVLAGRVFTGYAAGGLDSAEQ
jgi:elongation factor 1-alpha